jgi:hypothetical protein
MEYGTTISTVLELDEDMEPHLILGAGNPQLADQALCIERDIGLTDEVGRRLRAALDAISQ